MSEDKFDTYDFLINDEDEVMLLLYVRDSEPQNPSIEVDFETKTAILHRNESDGIELNDISDDILDALEETDKLLVCELSHDDNENETKIVYAYEAELTD
jgi:hypothetical protein